MYNWDSEIGHTRAAARKGLVLPPEKRLYQHRGADRCPRQGMGSSRCCREASKKPSRAPTHHGSSDDVGDSEVQTVEGYADYGETPCFLSNKSLHLSRMPIYSQHHRRNLYLFHTVQHRPSPDPLLIHFCTAFSHSSSPASSVHAFVAKTRRPAPGCQNMSGLSLTPSASLDRISAL